MTIKNSHINQDKMNIFRSTKDAIVDFTHFLLLGAASFSISVLLIFLVIVTSASLLEPGFSYAILGIV